MVLYSPQGCALGTPESCGVTILDPPPPTVVFSPNPVNVNVGATVGLTATVSPANAQNITFESSNTQIATVSGNSPNLNVSGVAEGTAQVVAKQSGTAIGNVNLVVAPGDKKQEPKIALIDPIAPTTTIGPNDPINVLRNPSAVVIETPVADGSNAAQFHALILPDDDPAFLEWVIKSVQDDDDATDDKKVVAEERAKFHKVAGMIAGNVGKTVYVHGVKAGRIRLEVWPKGADQKNFKNRLDYCEAYVVDLKTISIRVNLLSGPGVVAPVTQKEAEDHINIANRYLRQVGVQLKESTDDTITKEPAIYEDPIMVKAAYFTAKLKDDIYVSKVEDKKAKEVTSRVNYRPKILQVQYIETFADLASGYAPLFPGNDAKNPLEVIFRAELDPAVSKLATMSINTAQLHAEIKDIWAIIIPRADKAKDGQKAQFYERTIAHEVGHVMGLFHPDSDKVKRTLAAVDRNIMMQAQNDPTIGVEFDLIQLQGLRKSQALK